MTVTAAATVTLRCPHCGQQVTVLGPVAAASHLHTIAGKTRRIHWQAVT